MGQGEGARAGAMYVPYTLLTEFVADVCDIRLGMVGTVSPTCLMAFFVTMFVLVSFSEYCPMVSSHFWY